MKTRWKILLGVIAVAVLGLWLARDKLMMLAYMPTLPTIADAGVRFATIPSDGPADGSCLVEDSGGDVARELINMQRMLVVAGVGESAMPLDEWAGFEPDLPWLKNLNRNLMYDEDCFYRSPDAPASCSGADCGILQDVAGYTWTELSAVVARDCIASADAGCEGAAPAPGALTLTVTRKCHRIVFDAEIYDLSDPSGNRYVMHANATGAPDLSAALPEGWTLERRDLDAPLVVMPFGGGENCYHNILRDDLGQGYHQYVFAGERFP